MLLARAEGMQIAGTSLKPFEVWRRDVTKKQALDFARSIAATMVRGGSGGMVTSVGPRPAGMLILYEREACPYSRLVREALSALDLDVLIKPCPPGEWRHRGELRMLSGEETVPFLVDEGAGFMLGGSQQIIQYLFDHYGDRRVPLPLRFQPLAELTSKVATLLRGKDDRPHERAAPPVQPLELWSYEASPYSRVVREKLGELGVPYICHNMARGSLRRAVFVARHGREQFPLLHDPNTNVLMFESDEIVRYLDDQYAPRLRLAESARRFVILVSS
jgi:glutathione S-transferase